MSASLEEREGPAEDAPGLETCANQATEICARELGKVCQGGVWRSELSWRLKVSELAPSREPAHDEGLLTHLHIYIFFLGRDPNSSSYSKGFLGSSGAR